MPQMIILFSYVSAYIDYFTRGTCERQEQVTLKNDTTSMFLQSFADHRFPLKVFSRPPLLNGTHNVLFISQAQE